MHLRDIQMSTGAPGLTWGGGDTHLLGQVCWAGEIWGAESHRVKNPPLWTQNIRSTFDPAAPVQVDQHLQPHCNPPTCDPSAKSNAL